MKEYKKAKGAGSVRKAKASKPSVPSRPSKAKPNGPAVKISERRLDAIAREARKVRDGFDGLRISLDFLEFHFNELKKDIEAFKKPIRGAGSRNRAAAKKPCLAKEEGLSEAVARFGGLSRSGGPVTDDLQKEIVERLKAKILSDFGGQVPEGACK